MGLDVLREFWPEIARKVKMPFRGLRKEPPARSQWRLGDNLTGLRRDHSTIS